MFENEEWKQYEPIPRYAVSTHGRTKNLEKDKILKPVINDAGFPVVTFYGNDSRTRRLKHINQLVASCFLPEPFYPEQTSVWHIDGDLLNVRADNLRWDTRSRVLSWNEMNRRGAPQFRTGQVRNNRTGIVYDCAYDCAMAESELEDTIIWKIENHSPRYSYV